MNNAKVNGEIAHNSEITMEVSVQGNSLTLHFDTIGDETMNGTYNDVVDKVYWENTDDIKDYFWTRSKI